MPAGLTEQDDAMSPQFDCLRDIRQVEGHGLIDGQVETAGGVCLGHGKYGRMGF